MRTEHFDQILRGIKDMKKKKGPKKHVETEKKTEGEEKLLLDMKEVDLVIESPLGREKIASKEEVEIPLPSSEEVVETKRKRDEEERISLRDVRNYVNLNFKNELKKVEEESTKIVYERGLIRRILGFKGKRKLVRTGQTKKFVLDHLVSTKPFPKRIGTVAIAFYLKEFLEVIFGIKEELSHEDLAEALETKDMDENLKKELRNFFRSIAKQIYEGRINLDYQKSYDLAERTVKKLLEATEKELPEGER
jgi:D-ribose pyranose/furanose isomerase RbsD